MKIGLVIDDHMARPGGVQEYVRGIYRYLVQHGHEAVIFSSAGGSPEETLRLIPVGSALPFRGSGSSTSIPVSLASSSHLRQLLQDEACDILHVMAPYSPTLSGRLLMQSPALNIMTFHVAAEPGLGRVVLGVLAKAQYRSLQRFHARIAVPPTAAATARVYYGGTYEIIPNGVDTTHFVPDAVPLPELRDGSVNLLYVGRLEQRKGVIYLVRAFARLAQQYPYLRLIIGGDGPERPRLEGLVRHLGLEQISFLGYVPPSDLPRLLASADIFCAPAIHKESFGIVILEAFAAGLPVIAAANAGYAGLLAAHPGNLLVPPANHYALAGAIATIVDHPAYRRKIGQRNRRTVARYSWDTVGNQLLMRYTQLMAERA